MNYRQDIGNLYLNLLEEGVEEKIPKLLNLVDTSIENKEDYIRWAANTFDPTENGTYLAWILRMLKRKVLAGEEDGPKVKERLTQFGELKKKPQFPKEKRDINSFQNYEDLAETIDQSLGIQTKGEKKRRAREEGIQFIDSSEGEEGKGVSLYIVTGEEAGAKHFRNTKWCVKDPRHFNGSHSSPPYYYFTYDDEPYTLVHLASRQCMDVNNRETDLNSDEIGLMESQEMTEYVLNNNNSDNALDFYVQKVGDGYDGQIAGEITSRIDEKIREANTHLNLFNIYEYDGDGLEYWTPTAGASIPYDLTPYEQYIEDGDKDFKKEVIDFIERDFGINIDEYTFEFSDDLDSMNFYVNNDNYDRDDKLDDLISTLNWIESRYDKDDFDKDFKERMFDAGYLSSGWSDFINKVPIDSLEFKHFKLVSAGVDKMLGVKYMTDPVKIKESGVQFTAVEFKLKDANFILSKYRRDQHPYVLLTAFLKPFIDNGLVVYIKENARVLQFEYELKYENDKVAKKYLKSLKAIKDFDTHYDFYIEQIRDFMNKYVYPYLQNYYDNPNPEPEAYGIPANIKLPLIKIKGRKENPAQGMLDLHEKKKFQFHKRFNNLYKDLL